MQVEYGNRLEGVRTLLGSDQFTYAQNAVNEEAADGQFAEFDI